MPRRPVPTAIRPLAPSAPRRRPAAEGSDLRDRLADVRGQAPASPAGLARRRSGGLHPLSDGRSNAALQAYDQRVKQAFDRIVPLLKQLSALQHDDDFVAQAQQLAKAQLGYELPLPILERAWVSQLDMRTLFAWCVFETFEQTSANFFQLDPLEGQRGSEAAQTFETFLLEPHLPAWEPADRRWGFLFNSYYDAVGARHPRPRRARWQTDRRGQSAGHARH